MTGTLEGEGVDCSIDDDDDDGVVRGGESDKSDGDGESSGVKVMDGGDRL